MGNQVSTVSSWSQSLFCLDCCITGLDFAGGQEERFLNEIGANELSKIPKGHTLTKSFYLLNKFPGKWDNRILFIENNNLEYKDGVSSIILGFNDWAKAWAVDDNNLPLFPVVPGGERQRELSYSCLLYTSPSPRDA